jgi:actin-related protein 8
VIQVSLRDRMRFYKLRMTPDAAIKAAGFNEQLKPELIPEQNDPFRVDWIHDIATEPFFVGEKVRQAFSDVEPSHVFCRRCGLPILKSRGTL